MKLTLSWSALARNTDNGMQHLMLAMPRPGKSIIILHDPSMAHALKEVDAAANAVAQTPAQVVEIFNMS